MNVISKPITVIGMSQEGCTGLTSKVINAVAQAQVLVGAQRFLDFFPQFEGERLVIKGKMCDVIMRIKEVVDENQVVILASGDPLFFGIGNSLIQEFGVNQVEVIAHASSVQIAFARVGIKWDDAKIISLHGRSRVGLVTQIQQYHKIAILTDQKNSPSKIAQHMIKFKETDWKAWVCENVGGVDERVRCFTLLKLAQCVDIDDLNILILLRSDSNWRSPVIMPFLHEDDFAKRVLKKGLITKREARIISLGLMRLRRDSIVWDIGTASGSVAIEAAKICTGGKVYAVETDMQSIAICQENLQAHKVDNVELVEAMAPEALRNLPSPDAVFIGGSKGYLDEILKYSYAALKPEGWMVANVVTMESVQIISQYCNDNKLEYEMIVLNISRGVPLAQYHHYAALNPVHIFAIQKKNKEMEVVV